MHRLKTQVKRIQKTSGVTLNPGYKSQETQGRIWDKSWSPNVKKLKVLISERKREKKSHLTQFPKEVSSPSILLLSPSP